MYAKLLRHVAIILLSASATIASAQTFNPAAPAKSYNVFTTGNLTLQNGQTEGPVALGGNLTLAGSVTMAQNSSGAYPASNGSSARYGLVVGGRIFYNSGSVSYVNQGVLRIGSTTGTTLWHTDNNNASTNLQATSGSFNATPRVQLQQQQAAGTPTQSHDIDFALVDSQLTTASSAISGYQSNNHGGLINYITVPSGNNPQITLANNKVNFINLTAAQLSAIVNQGSFTFTNTPTASRPVIFNITTGGAVTFAAPNMGGVGPQDAPYMLWNFSAATSVNASGSNAIYGSVLAPDAAFMKNNGTQMCGQILTASATLSSGALTYQPFAAQIPGSSKTAAMMSAGTMAQYSNAVALDIHAMQLTAAAEVSGARVSWASEGMEDEALAIERSADGLVWNELQKVSGERGNMLDAAASAINYYRLRATGRDGRITFSNIATARIQKSIEWSAGPNPFTSYVSIRIEGTGRSTLSLLDAAGRVLRNEVVEGNSGVVMRNLDSFPAGWYMLRAQGADGTTAVQKLVKQ